MLIVLRYESETILLKSFVLRSHFGMTSLTFLTKLPLFELQVGVAFAFTAASTSSAIGLLPSGVAKGERRLAPGVTILG